MAVAFAACFVTRLPVCQSRSTLATVPTASAFWAARSRCPSSSLTRPSTSRGANRGRSSALPIAGARRPGGSAPNAPRSSAADQTLDCHHPVRFAVCGPVPWMIPPGYARQLISGHAARSPGSCCRQTDRGSRHSLRTQWVSCYRRRREPWLLNPPPLDATWRIDDPVTGRLDTGPTVSRTAFCAGSIAGSPMVSSRRSTASSRPPRPKIAGIARFEASPLSIFSLSPRSVALRQRALRAANG
jgi:hypothetical protein